MNERERVMSSDKNMLIREQMRKLEDLILEHKEEIEGAKWTQKGFAEHAMRKLGRPVTVRNIQGACKVVGVNWVSSYFQNGSKSKPKDRRLQDLERVVYTLSLTVRKLLCDLGSDCTLSLVQAIEYLERVVESEVHRDDDA